MANRVHKVYPAFKNTRSVIKGVKEKQLLILPIFMKAIKRNAIQSIKDPQIMKDQNSEEEKSNTNESKTPKNENQEQEEDLIMCIQCEGKSKSDLNKNNLFFTLLDEMFLTVYSECVANAVSRIVAYKEIQNQNARINEIFDFCKSVVNEHDHNGLQERVENSIASLLDYESATLLMVEPSSRSLYRIFGDIYSKSNGEIIKLPKTLGLTSLCYGSNEIVINNEGIQNREYKEEVDNILNHEFTNSIVVPLHCNKSPLIVGVLHLYNHKYGLTVTDIIEIKHIGDMIGTCIENANQLSEITIKIGEMKKKADKKLKEFESNDKGIKDLVRAGFTSILRRKSIKKMDE